MITLLFLFFSVENNCKNLVIIYDNFVIMMVSIRGLFLLVGFRATAGLFLYGALT